MKRFTLPVVFLTLLLTACASTTPVMSIPEQWQKGLYEFKTELKQSDRVHSGVLSNGLRYHLVENQTPKNEIIMRMHVAVGSIYEQEDEQGLAHLLEHMAFNGSKNVPEGEMVAILERVGLAFGADTNASTSFEETIYKLNLPQNDPQMVDTALFLLRETASNLLIEPSALAKEIPVVTAEFEARNNIYAKAFKSAFSAWTEGLIYPERFAIGKIPVLEAMQAQQLRDFYNRHYTIDNTQIIIVGDFVKSDMLVALEKHFADWDNSQAPVAVDIGTLKPFTEPQVNIFTGAGLPTQVSLNFVTPWNKQEDTIETRRANTIVQLANGILNYRLSSLVLAGNAPFEGAGAGHSVQFSAVELSQLAAQTTVENWSDSLAVLVNEVEKMKRFGVTDAELIRQVSAVRNALFTAAAEKDTMQSSVIANALLGYINNGGFVTEPDLEFALFSEMMETFSLAEVNAVIKAQFERTMPLIHIQSEPAFNADKNEVIRVYQSALQDDVTKNAVQAKSEFAYTDFGPMGEITEQAYDETDDIHQYTFANGVRVLHKPTTLTAGEVLINVHYGPGTKSLPKHLPGLKELYNFYYVAGLGKHDINELRSILSDKDVSLNFSARFNGLGGVFSSSAERIDIQLQLITAFITDPSLNPDLLNLYRKNIEQSEKERKTTLQAVRSYELTNQLYGNDYRIGAPPTEALLARDFTDIDTLLQQALQGYPFTVTVVGDIAPDVLKDAVAKTFGALAISATVPEREWVDDFALIAPQTFTLEHAGNPENAAVLRRFKTVDRSDIKRSATLNVLADVMRLKVQAKIREELGAAYSPAVVNNQSRDIKDDGFIGFDTLTSPSQIPEVQQAYTDIIAELQTVGGITEDELQRALQPILANLASSEERNGFWLYRVDRLHREPNTMQEWRNLPELYQSITVADLRASAMRYLIPERQIDGLILPMTHNASQ